MLSNLLHKVYCYNNLIAHEKIFDTKTIKSIFNKHYIKLLKTKKNNYDALIFVWCGHGSIAAEGDTLVTSMIITLNYLKKYSNYLQMKYFMYIFNHGKFIIDSSDTDKGKGRLSKEIIQTTSTLIDMYFFIIIIFQKALKEKVKMEKYDQNTKNKVNTEVVLLSNKKYCFNKD
ncbi:hypothetical protein RFI_03761 [Reticulomyxa filosa]|uniref:Caspase family p20 domain-containing protein n=1 Tax=Reticulomyxa filosa TaxID=46433 RepID=X6P462_RETFI|nr:hypothetical protein RFI_03761 [Reticulomyxa filosa]|eukprot:ETO33345.1 hypothetical protein RFI_03761 [Reticulomyxa filosa]